MGKSVYIILSSLDPSNEFREVVHKKFVSGEETIILAGD